MITPENAFESPYVQSFVLKLHKEYLDWLMAMVNPKHGLHDGDGYYILLERLHNERYIANSLTDKGDLNDSNRFEDGMHLRHEFLYQKGYPDDYKRYFYDQCSMLEMMIALADRSYINYSGGTEKLFWHMIENMGLLQIKDSAFDFEEFQEISNACDTVVMRGYDSSGAPGPFRVYGDKDARVMGLWEQMFNYTTHLDQIEDNNED